jgi:hypothetical protein
MCTKSNSGASAPGIVTFTVNPSAAARKALRNALAHHQTLPVTAVLTFQSARGGAPTSRTLTIHVKPRKAGRRKR